MKSNGPSSSEYIWTFVICVIIFFGLWYILSLFGATDNIEKAHANIATAGIVSGIISIILFFVRILSISRK